ncbi:MAG: site-2 protease family protein [Clostridia bacterium]|nr:site-2 protease family protein [Clostridia bacterium]
MLWILSGNASAGLTLFLVLLLHELAHGIIANLLGMKTESITFYLFGGEAEIRGIGDNFAQEGIVAAIGPIASVLTGFLWQKMSQSGIAPPWEDFVQYSYAIGVFNLLPVYPLDGGRILCAGLKGALGEKRGKKICLWFGLACSALFFIFSLFILVKYKKSTTVVMAAFMLTASAQAMKIPKVMPSREKVWRNKDVKIIKLSCDTPLTDAFNEFGGGKFFIVLLENENGRIEGALTEKEIFNGLLLDSRQTLKQLKKHL